MTLRQLIMLGAGAAAMHLGLSGLGFSTWRLICLTLRPFYPGVSAWRLGWRELSQPIDGRQLQEAEHESFTTHHEILMIAMFIASTIIMLWGLRLVMSVV